jgi:E3 ubiquitin-protein ligase SHPRH
VAVRIFSLFAVSCLEHCLTLIVCLVLFFLFLFITSHEKSDQIVQDSINVPKQHNHRHLLKFRPIERHFYKDQQKNVSESVLQTLLYHNQELDSEESVDPYIPLAVFDSLSSEMLRLRQACCHPQIGMHGIFRLNTSKKTMTMSQIHELIIANKSKVCTGHLRWKLLGMNGIAGLLLLQDKRIEAIEQYKKVLQVVLEMNREFKVDKYVRSFVSPWCNW